MTIERRALQWVAIGHAIVNPLPVQFVDGQPIIASKRIDDPDVLVKNLSRFHIKYFCRIAFGNFDATS